MKDFIDKYITKDDDVPIEIWEAIVHLKESVNKYNNPYPFNPWQGGASFYFFYKRINEHAF